MSTECRLDRDTNPELSGLFDAFDDLVRAPADPALRTAQIERAALLARTSTAAASTIGRDLRRAATWRVAGAAAAVLAVAAGLGADDRLPSPAQRVASSIAGMIGIELPDASHRHDPVEPHEHDGTPGRSSTVPAEPGDPVEPADPATPAAPDGGETGGEASTLATNTTSTTSGTQGVTEPTEPDKTEKTSPTPPTTPSAGDDRGPAGPSTTVATTPQTEPEKKQNQNQSVVADPDGPATTAE